MSLSSSSLSTCIEVGACAWSGQPLPPKEFLKAFTLPQVVRIHDLSVGRVEKIPPKVDLRQPFLLYKSYASVKVHARSVQHDARGCCKEVGPTIVIPQDYTGWFSVVTDNGRTANFFTSVEQLAHAHVPYFLVRNDVPAYRVSDPRIIAGKTSYTKCTVKTGHVLKLLGVYEDINARHYKNLNRNHKNNCSKYAQCVNYKGEVLFLSFSVQGKFYATATRGARTINHVYLMSQLLKTFKFPIAVRLVCGFLPKIPCNFTGTLRLQNVRREDIILACTLLKERNVMLEIDASSGFLLSKAVNQDLYIKNELYQGAMAFCSDEADIWRRQMKVVHHIYPQTETTTSSNKLGSGTNTNMSLGSGSGSGSGQGSGSSSGSGSRKPLLKKNGSVPLVSRYSTSSKHETQSVCISMIFDELDEEEITRSEKELKRDSLGNDNSRIGQNKNVPQRTATPTKFWTLRRLKQLVQNEPHCDSPYSVIHPKDDIYEVIDDGSENANAEFMSPVSCKVLYPKFPSLEMPTNKDVIYDSIC